MDKIITTTASVEIIAEGYTWSEGPVWIEKENMLLFSDVPENIVYKWTEENGAEPYLTPSGFTGDSTRSRERGSNGLIIHNDSLILCQHGNRQVAKMKASVRDPKPEFVTLAGYYDGKRFNSPNDAAYRSNGDLFFTDPPYGLGDQDKDVDKETPINGVYRVSSKGIVSLLVDSITKPNGIAFMPEGNKFLVACSDPAKAIWYEFELNDVDSIKSARIFYDATSPETNEKGLPDGLKIDSKGNVFATGPGGVWIFNKDGKVLGKIKLPEASANCALSPDEKTLYITADMYLLRVKMRD
ncbi:SMP-30/gluconolactonase/LRE family protein [Dolichospermum sp. ST_sed3]|nr:SMP-30/gluconolactonase/LRE family protein [Dolichospermum sp. ST_sed3]